MARHTGDCPSFPSVLDSACARVSEGNRVAVLLEVEEYRRLLDALEELESIRAYDTAVAVREDAIPFDHVETPDRK